MPTIIERETRLVAFLRILFPAHRVVPSLQRLSDARRTDVVDTPEIRVLLDGIREGSALRWLLQFVEGSPGNAAQRRIGATGILSSAQKIRGALASNDAIYRAAGGRLARRDEVADVWEEIIEEAFTPGGRVPQALFAAVSEYAFSDEHFPAGTNNFGAVDPDAESAEPGDSMMIGDAEGYQFLGAVIQSEPELITEFSIVRAITGLTGFLLLSEAITAPEAGNEIEDSNPADSAVLQFSMSGVRRKKLIGPQRDRLRMEFPQIAQTKIAGWKEYLKENAERASFILARSNSVMVEASPVSLEARVSGSGEAGSLSVEFVISPLGDLSPFTAMLP
ncbi:MAG: hypothetical protein ABI579_01165 [Candidatus Sumerlaeota bacterium]